LDSNSQNEIVQGYEIKKSVVFDNNRGFALAENPNAVQPFVTWIFTEDEHGKRDYDWGHYTTDGDKAEQDFEARVSEYIKDHGVCERAAQPTQQDSRYYTIDEQAARRAKEANSFRDYKPGSATAGYREMVDRAYELGERQKQHIDPMHHEKIDRLVDKYARKLAENLNNRNVIDTRVPSMMISGGGNFPVRKKEKQNAARDKNMGEYTEIAGLLDKIQSIGTGGISADDRNAAEKLEAKLDSLMQSQETMKTANAYYRKHKTLDDCPDLSQDTINKLKVSMSRHYREGAPPFPSWQLSNNNAEIRRIRQRIEEVKNKSEFAGWEFEGGRAEANEDENRLQLLFDDKPTDEQRKALKENGFKWAPSQGAWQRQLTKNAIYSAGRLDFIKPTDGQTPYQLQPFARKEAQDRGDR